MDGRVLKSAINDAASRGLGIDLFIGSDRFTVLPLSVQTLDTGELEIRATHPTILNDVVTRPVPGTPPPSLPHRETWTIVPASVSAVRVLVYP